jgi:hypothetical protein
MIQAIAARPEDAVPWINLEQQLRQETPRQWATRFKGASSNECNRLLITLARSATNTQLARLFQILRQREGQLPEALQRWRATLTRLSPTIFSERTRYKSLISEGDSHWLIRYTRTNAHATHTRSKPNPALIGFTGSAGLLMAPIACILTTLAPTSYDLIVVRRRHRESYFSNNSSSLRSISNYLQSTLKDQLSLSIALGTSNGGLAGLCMAHTLHLPLGIAISAGATSDTFLANSPLTQALQSLQRRAWPLPWLGRKSRLLLTASAEHQTDATSAHLICDHFNRWHRHSTQATALLFPDCSSHNLPDDLSHKGISLEQWLLPLIQGDLSRLPAHQRHPSQAWPQATTTMTAPNR